MKIAWKQYVQRYKSTVNPVIAMIRKIDSKNDRRYNRNIEYERGLGTI